jgi:hypothetical protein
MTLKSSLSQGMNKSGDSIKTQYRIMGEKSARELGGEDG